MASGSGGGDGGGVRFNIRVKPDGPPIPVACKFYREGYCANGNRCRFRHEDRKERQQQGAPEAVPLARPSPEDFRLTPSAAPSPEDFRQTPSAAPGDAGAGGMSDFTSVYQALFEAEGTDPSGIYDMVSPQSKKYAEILTGEAPSPGRGGGRYDSAPGWNPSDMLCTFHMNGVCRYASSCRYVHGDQCPSCGKNALHPYNMEEAEEHFMNCSEKQDRLFQMDMSRDIECGICYEKPVVMRRKFGLLQNCEHAFCLDCIREWRGNTEDFGAAVRQCPLCRIESYIVIPSTYFVTDPDERAEMFRDYAEKLGKIPCKYFDSGDGDCPFSTSCLYAHIDKAGNDKKDTLILNEDGKAVAAPEEVNLLDFSSRSRPRI